MRLLWFTSIFLHQFSLNSAAGYTPWIEKYYYPGFYSTPMSIYVNGTDTEIQSTQYTPDYRVEEKMYTIHSGSYFKEQNRPYRITPIAKQTYYWNKYENAGNLGCYCCCTYRRYVVLAGCAVISTRHILTTANPTVLILRSYGHLRTLEGILGGWYETDYKSYNSSLYYSVSRIHIHPMYKYDYEANVTHPIPVMYDISLWAATFAFYGSSFFAWSKAVICQRAASGWFEYSSTIPRKYDLSAVVGQLFMKAFKRRPLPWFRYAVKTKDYTWPCPKSDWHWFHCIRGEYWGRFGFDSGGAMHMMMESKSRRSDGLAGLCSFSLKLRGLQTIHYFTVLDTYPVLDFLYDGFLGLKQYAYLDYRFQDTRWAAPVPWWGEYINQNYYFGFEYAYEYLISYRR